MLAKKILIIDEAGFSRICSAMLESDGYLVENILTGDALSARLNHKEFGLIITSYPYGAFFFDEIKRRGIPVIILSGHVDRELMNAMGGFPNSYCMLKPLDYQRFRAVIRNILNGKPDIVEGHIIV